MNCKQTMWRETGWGSADREVWQLTSRVDISLPSLSGPVHICVNGVAPEKDHLVALVRSRQIDRAD